jgi:hypothetical protein
VKTTHCLESLKVNRSRNRLLKFVGQHDRHLANAANNRRRQKSECFEQQTKEPREISDLSRQTSSPIISLKCQESRWIQFSKGVRPLSNGCMKTSLWKDLLRKDDENDTASKGPMGMIRRSTRIAEEGGQPLSLYLSKVLV